MKFCILGRHEYLVFQFADLNGNAKSACVRMVDGKCLEVKADTAFEMPFDLSIADAEVSEAIRKRWPSKSKMEIRYGKY